MRSSANGAAVVGLWRLARALDGRRGIRLSMQYLRLYSSYQGSLASSGGAERRLHGVADARLVAVLDHGLALGREGLLPVEGGLQRPARRQVLLPCRGRRRIPRSRPCRAGAARPTCPAAAGRAPRWCGADAAPAECRAFAAVWVRSRPAANDTLLDLRVDRLAVHDGGEGEEVDRVVGRHRDELVRAFDVDVGHRKRHQHGDVLVRLVEEAVADADLLGGDREILGHHLDGVVADEDQPAGGELGGGIVGEGGRRPQRPR